MGPLMEVPHRHYGYCLYLGLWGCLATPPAPGHNEQNITLDAIDARGTAVSLAELPRRPRFTLVTPTVPDPDSAAPWLFEGPPDTVLLQDLDRLPLTAASSARLQHTRKLLHGHTTVIEPLEPLTPGATYTLALPRTAVPELKAPWTSELRVDASSASGAAFLRSFPAAEARDIAPELSHAVLAFDGDVDGYEHGIWVEDPQGLAVAGSAELAPCEEYESAAVSCIVWRPGQALEPGTRYVLRTGRDLHDAHGAELAALRVGFTTRVAAATPVRTSSRAASCGIDELTLPCGCVLMGDVQLSLRVSMTSQLRVRASLANTRFARLPDNTDAYVSFAELVPNSTYTLTFESIDSSEQITSDAWPLRTTAPLATLSIDKVYADPRGPEPDQEFIELLNYGDAAVSLHGIQLFDASEQAGTRITEEIWLEPGARALLVSTTYDPRVGTDPAPVAGAVLVRVGKGLTRSGLSNAGEPLYLRDAQGHRLSAAPALPKPRAGQCLVRISADPRTGEPGSFDYGDEDSCLPGG